MTGQDRQRSPRLKSLLPLLVLAALLATVYTSGLSGYLSFDALRANLDAVEAVVAKHKLLSFLGLVIVYALGTAISVPAMSVLTIAAGLVFGLFWGFLGVYLGAVAGATILFLIVRSSYGATLKARLSPWLGKLERGFRQNEFNYLLALRLVPVFPFWVLNIAPAILGMRLGSYVAATAIGIGPGTFVYVWVGRGAAETIRLGGEVNAADLLFQFHVIGPILALAALSLVPVVGRAIRSRQKRERKAKN